MYIVYQEDKYQGTLEYHVHGEMKVEAGVLLLETVFSHSGTKIADMVMLHASNGTIQVIKNAVRPIKVYDKPSPMWAA